ncbi:uncharacterized protein ALTATR162_LOCUS1325 [Alternaria atra]|uniref:Uncharacterized protein n=1 Tax=Alternaria atra TaxID=119953 RepID=A0A8J2HVX5_9PLEO|nr:uncharacterized protein ALTATR162_LOCUS1325 [Alternaria atra]CAG5143311.1 unnamed protein product [Alternaria atra]
MAAAAHSVPGLEFSTVDDMDLHSDDGGLDFNDGDIELDLDPPPSNPLDDEMSMNDAASANGIDVETIPGEQDDFMVDQEDVIEEDYSYQEDHGVIVVDQPVAIPSQPIPVTSPPAPVNLPPIQTDASNQDDDLIDYSEEEGEDYHNPELRSPWLRQESYYSETQEAQDEQAKDITEQQDEIPADLQALLSMPANNKSPSPYVEAQSAADPNAHGLAADEHAHSPRPQSVDNNEEDGQNDDGDGDGGVMLPGQEEHADTETQNHDSAHHGHDQEASTEENEHQDPESFELPPVTVNYHGEELWLFKQHDYENSGEWLIQDTSIAKASLSELFQACRLSLGEDVSGETEIGFRFEHLQNLEIFEDNTACVAVSLERLVGYYHALHAQDGNNAPDSFYISLMFRPRFAILLSDIAKYADQGSGYSDFEAAVLAGETHFAGIIGETPSDEPTEWGTQEQEQDYDEQQIEKADAEVTEFAKEEALLQEDGGKGNESEGEGEQETHSVEEVEVHEDEHNSAEHTSYHELDHSEANHEQNTHKEESAEGTKEEEVEVEHSFHEEQEPTAEEDHSLQAANPSDVSANPHEVVDQAHQESPKPNEETDAEAEARRLQEQEDFVDYSDEDEPTVNVKEDEEAPATEPSPSSVTLQDDEFVNADEHGSVAGSISHNERASQNDNEANEEPHVEVERDETEGNDGNGLSYQDGVQVFDEDDPFQDFHAEGTDGTDGYAADAYDGDANQDFANQLDFMNGGEFNAAGAETTDGNDLTGTDDFLDLENNPEWDADQELDQEDLEKATNAHDHVDTQDREDGVAGETTNATSSAADPTTASSGDAQEVSPQGQKRSIDEAGHGEDIAPDSIGMLISPSRKRNSDVDYFVPDAKRARV